MTTTTTSSSSSPPAAAAAPAMAEQLKTQLHYHNKKQNKTKSMTMSRSSSSGRVRPKLPTGEELIGHYESQGMDTKQASLKVINDLQNAIFKLISTNQLDGVNRRLMTIDMKLDSKPGYPHMFGLGLASAAAFRTIETVALPPIASAFANIWNAVRSTTNPN